MDAALWFTHWLFHVVPELWEFHKVHHSAEVMTPITAARMHPVEEIVDQTLELFERPVALGARHRRRQMINDHGSRAPLRL